jgi:hypothetical protein
VYALEEKTLDILIPAGMVLSDTIPASSKEVEPLLQDITKWGLGLAMEIGLAGSPQ